MPALVLGYKERSRAEHCGYVPQAGPPGQGRDVSAVAQDGGTAKNGDSKP